MRYEYLIQKDASPTASIKALLAREMHHRQYNTVCAAMAYVTIAGLRDVLGLLLSPPVRSQWLIGLDDALSQPGAIELCLSLESSDVRVASFEHEARRFHPKVLYLLDSTHRSRAFMVIGSANLTKHALAGNAESIVLLHADSSSDKRELDSIWADVWRLGRPLKRGELDHYRSQFTDSSRFRREARRSRAGLRLGQAKRKTREVLADDMAEVDPGTATVCWIECGYVTAMGRELEFKAEQGLFFGLNPHGGDPTYLNYRVSNGTTVQLRMKYQGNHMWRLQMTKEVPEVAEGLRPRQKGKLMRSPWVAVFERLRTKDTYRLYFVKLRSASFRQLKERSERHGTIGRTTAREYGWF
ncbi:hypothetical protein COMA2_300006 [Candidatus Nitrospira nitrificans]|uniref:Uncharacterized protein n=2 Tax=Candidatus Nitrospira nitrificans TaxID=1742973 RepID=A0A0S4LJB3_9BACT|nr:hypothetical protein COMA2_300006 [Candidatus Nitrospira nitrificans]